MKKIIYCMVLAFVIVSATPMADLSVELQKNTLPVLASPQPKENVTITLLFNEFNEKGMGKSLVDSAINKLRSNHADLNINLSYIETGSNNKYTHDQMFKAITNGTPVDIVTLDQIWLGEFAQNGLLTDLTNYTKKWGRLSDLYQSNIDGMIYNKSLYGIWAWTDVRGIWYWKDLLSKANVDPNLLKTWDGYSTAAKKLNAVLRPQGIEGVHLTGADHSPDLWHPYLWMLGGELIKMKTEHPTRGDYWFPAYNSTEGVRAMEFLKHQVDADIRPQKNHYFGKEFVNKNFSVMIEGSWMPSNLPKQEFGNIEFIPMFPVPDNNTMTSTLMGGWEFSIPKTSPHKDLAWELIEIMLEPGILSPWIAEQGYLPTQTTMGEGQGPYTEQLRKSIPFYDKMISMIHVGRGRPSIPEYPAIAMDIRQAIDEVYYGLKDPKQALQEAATRSAKALGW